MGVTIARMREYRLLCFRLRNTTKKTSFYTSPTAMKAFTVCEAAAPELGGPALQRERWPPSLDLALLQAPPPPPFFRTRTS